MPKTTPTQADPNLCPCSSGAPKAQCCLPLIQGKKKAATAEEMLRSRYTAFALGEIDYILKTHHSKTRDQIDRKEVEDWSKSSEWLGLEIVQQEGGTASDERGAIVFCARYSSKDEGGAPEAHEHWEQSYFEKESGEWRFLDARNVQIGTYRRTEPKVGRNDACPCGSGKKYKKCCA